MENLPEIKRFSRTQKIFLIAAVCLAAGYPITIICLYFWRFPSISSDPAVWGQFGDYLGGSTNSFFSILSFFALLYVIYLQRSELKATIRELELTRNVHEEQLENARKQAEIASFLEVVQNIGADLDILLDQVITTGMSISMERYTSTVRSVLVTRPEHLMKIVQDNHAVFNRLIAYVHTLGYYLQQNQYISMWTEHYYISKYGEYFESLRFYKLLGKYEALFKSFYERNQKLRQRFLKRD